MKRRNTLKLLLTGIALCLGLQAHAQNKPPIRLLVGFPPGGSTDMVARLLADRLRAQLDQTVVVENKPGAGGRVASLALKNSDADGLTYLIMPNASAVLNHLLYPTETLNYDLLTDMTPVAMVVSYPMGMAVSASLGVNDARQYVEWVKKSGRPGLYGTAGQGGQTHFTGLQLGKAADIEMKVVPYRGNGPMLTDLLGGQIPAGIAVVGDFLQHVKDGKLRAIGVFGSKRSPLAPDVPTFKEQGFEVDTGDAWTGMWAPAGTPAAELQRMQAALKNVLAQADVRETLERSNMSADYRPAGELSGIVRRELDYWGPVIEESGFTPEK